jgi:hypothetical protein
MTTKTDYLSDEELMNLISDVEVNMQVQAPSNLTDNVVASIEAYERKKTVSFCQYCLRVGFAVAAAIALISIVPLVHDSVPRLPAREYTMSEKKVESRDEVVTRRGIKSKDEVLRDRETSYFEETENTIRSYINGLFE